MTKYVELSTIAEVMLPPDAKINFFSVDAVLF